jgi:superfamily II DNA or RNA helicase
VTTSPTIDLSFDRGTLVLRGSAQCAGFELDSRIGALRAHAIDYLTIRTRLLQEWGPRFTDRVPLPPRVNWPKVEPVTLRAEQQSAVDAWRAADGRGCIIMPTGTGKTEVALAAMLETRVATLVVAPVRDLMHQWHRRILRSLGYDAGIVGDSIFNLQPVTVTTYDSAYARMAEMGDRFGLIIFDEAHHLPGRCYRESALMCTAPMRLGLTATPERSDGRHVDLESLIGPTVYRQEIANARGKTLSDFDIVRIPVKLNDDEQCKYDQASKTLQMFFKTKRDEAVAATGPDGKPLKYTWEDLLAESGRDPAARAAQTAFYFKKSIEDRATEKLRVLEDIFRLHLGQRVIVFAGSNAMAIDVSRRFLIPTLLAHSRKKERLAVLDGFAGDRFPVLVANQVLDEGVDVPAAKVAVVIGGLSSTRQAKQRLGRVLRRVGDARATLYEIVCEGTNDVERSRKRRRSDAYVKMKRKKM